jgi:hypothetical protein
MDQFLDHPVPVLSLHLLPEIFSVTLTSRPSVAAAGFRQFPVPPLPPLFCEVVGMTPVTFSPGDP